MKIQKLFPPVRRSSSKLVERRWGVGESFLLLALALVFSACSLFGPRTTTIDVTVAPGFTYELDLERSGDEESAILHTLPLHAEVSETYRDTVNYSIHYRYKPADGYTGDDYVKIALMYHEHPWDASIKTTGYIELNITVGNAERTGQ